MKKVLVITYYWPPSGGPGVQRVLKFCKYLPEFGWEPIVLTVKDGEYPNIDLSLEKEAEDLDIRVIKTKTSEPFALYKWMTGKKSMPSYELNKSKSGLLSNLSKWIRMNFFIPDARKGWIPYGVKAGRELLKKEKIDVIFSSGPPHSLHFIAKKLKEEFSVPWVADFRDPWTDPFYYYGNNRMKWARDKDQVLFEDIINECHKVTVVSPGSRKKLLNLFPNKSIDTIYNGFDESDFNKINSISRKNNTIIITHVGNLAKSQLSEGFIHAFTEIKKLNINIRLKLIGDVHNDFISMINDNGLESNTSFMGYIPHEKVIMHLISSDILLLVIHNLVNNESIIPGRMFEYLRARVPILFIGPPEGDAGKIISFTKSGLCFSYDDWEGIKSFICQNHNEFNPQNIGSFSRKELTKDLSRIFNDFMHNEI